jgi:hypothetical protein
LYRIYLFVAYFRCPKTYCLIVIIREWLVIKRACVFWLFHSTFITCHIKYLSHCIYQRTLSERKISTNIVVLNQFIFINCVLIYISFYKIQGMFAFYFKFWIFTIDMKNCIFWIRFEILCFFVFLFYCCHFQLLSFCSSVCQETVL